MSLNNSSLTQAIQEMRTMRESYDQLGAAAEAYNTGKTELAANITAKGVQASASETLPELAEKVSAIGQESYEIDGGEMYAKQLFGVADNSIIPGYWNLYEIMAQLLSDGRLVSYGGILLAEYYKGYDSLALAGAGAGGAYVVSDKDANGNFIMYTEDTTHVWDTAYDGKGNRWVAYCFADEAHGFQITNTDTCPRSIHIGRHVGVIESLVNGRVSEIVVTDGNKLDAFKTNSYTQNWNKNVILRNFAGNGNPMLYNPNSELIYISADNLNNCINSSGKTHNCVILQTTDNASLSKINSGSSTINTLIIKGGLRLVGNTPSLKGGFNTIIIEDIENFISANYTTSLLNGNSQPKIYLLACEAAYCTEVGTEYFYVAGQNDRPSYIYIGYKTNDRTKRVALKAYNNSVTDIELKAGYKKPCNVSAVSTNLTAENIALHMLDRLGDNTGESTLTLTIGSTNLNRILADETYAPYVAAAQAKNWTIA